MTTLTNTQTVTTQTGPSLYTIGLAYKSVLGSYLTNGSGWTLYLFAKDIPNNGTSACYGGCATAWPPFYSANLPLLPGLNASSFGTITRTDGTKQTMYDGWTLYHFTPDKQAGQTNGQRVGSVWYAWSLPVPSETTSTTSCSNSNSTSTSASGP